MVQDNNFQTRLSKAVLNFALFSSIRGRRRKDQCHDQDFQLGQAIPGFEQPLKLTQIFWPIVWQEKTINNSNAHNFHIKQLLTCYERKKDD